MEDTEDPKVGDLGDELRAYEHLQHLYMKGNDIRDIGSIAHLYHLLTVNFNTNSISSIRFFEELGGDNTRLQFLQVRVNKASPIRLYGLSNRSSSLLSKKFRNRFFVNFITASRPRYQLD